VNDAWRLRDGVLAQLELPHAILLDTASGDYYDLNATGTELLRAMLAGGDLDAAVAAIVARFDVDSARARADAEALLAELNRRRLLERV
jgi:hypothetical protein